MSWEYAIAGTIRLDRQGYITPTNTALRIYDVHLIASLPNVSIVIANVVPSTTATNTTNDYIRVSATTSTTTYHIGDYSNNLGMLFDNGALLHTCPAFSYALIDYVAISK